MPLTKPLLLLFFTIGYLNTLAQVRWSGLGGDGQWATPANWSVNRAPDAGDDVVLDHTLIAGNYTVALPSGNVTVTIRSLTITPATGNNIEVVLPTNNTALPGFSCSGSGYGLVINQGGIFRNASGAAAVSGTVTVAISDSLRINNGGRYVHNTPRTHANVVALLSKATGTATGLFEFDLSSGGALISFAGKTFGTLVLSATAAGGAKTYNANGATQTLIRGDLIIGDGVNFNLSLNDTIVIQGNYEQQGGIFNLGSAAYNTVVQVGKHFIQSKGIITENDNGLPVIEMNGASSQHITVAGSINNSVAFKVNNPAGVVLQTPLSLPYKLELTNGQVITSATNLLTLQAGCTVKADTLSSASFINGPLKKEGLMSTDQFLFPVGKGNAQRWLSLTNATGNYTVEFFSTSPQLMSNTYHATIHHISSIEHWAITADPSPAPQAQVKLSFNDPNSGGITELSALRVAHLSGGAWTNAGNTGSMGSPGSNGFVTSQLLYSFSTTAQYFTLASTSASFNPLLAGERPAIPANHTVTGVLAPAVTSNSTKLILTARKNMNVLLVITAATGRVVKTIPVYLQKGSNTISIPAAMFPAGIYTITIQGWEGMRQPVRFIKL